MQAVRGLLDDGRFKPYDTIALPKRAEATLVLNAETRPYDGGDIQRRIAWLNRIENAISESANEDFPDVVRQKMKPPHGLTD